MAKFLHKCMIISFLKKIHCVILTTASETSETMTILAPRSFNRWWYRPLPGPAIISTGKTRRWSQLKFKCNHLIHPKKSHYHIPDNWHLTCMPLQRLCDYVGCKQWWCRKRKCMEMQKSLGLAASGAISISAATPGSACQGSKTKLKPKIPRFLTSSTFPTKSFPQCPYFFKKKLWVGNHHHHRPLQESNIKIAQ